MKRTVYLKKINSLLFKLKKFFLCVCVELLIFKDPVFVEELVLEGNLDGVDIDDLFANVILNHSVLTNFTNASFDRLTIVGDLDIASNRIGNVDIVALNTSVIRLDRDETVTGLLKFSKVRYSNRKNT